MKYPWLVAITILPLVGAAEIADATTYKDIAGQWCGDVTDYVFTPDTLTVRFHDARPANLFKITKYTYTDNSMRIDWINDAGKESVTVFAEFVGNNTKMAQQENGDKPRRPFTAAECWALGEGQKTRKPWLSGDKRERIGGDGSVQTAKILKPREKSGSGK